MTQVRVSVFAELQQLNHRIFSICLSGRPVQLSTLRGYSDKDWDQFLALASREVILSSLFDVTTDLDLASYLPPHVLNVLSSIKKLNRARNRDILDQVKAICTCLNRQGIEPVALKGLAGLLAGIYPDLGTRFLADIDLLVPEHNFSLTLELLFDLGYTCDESDPVELVIGHSYPPLHRAGWAELDLHRDLGLGLCKSFLSASEVLRDSALLEFEGIRLRLPSPEHLLTHHIMHSQMHDSYHDRIWPSLRSMYDLALLHARFRSRIDWRNIEKRFDSHQQRGVLVMHLRQATSTLGFELPVQTAMNPYLRLRWWRRKILRTAPYLRFLDPLYFFFAGLMPRTRRVKEILKVPGGWRYLARKFVNPHFYARLRADLS